MAEGYPADVQKHSSEGEVRLLNYSFNQDYSCFVAGTTKGFRAFSSSPVSEVKRRNMPFGVSLVRMLFKTALFPLCTLPADEHKNVSHKIQVWDEQKAKFIAELRSKSEVKGIALIREIVVMACEKVLYVYRADNLAVMLTINTASNENGLCAISSAGKPWVLATLDDPPGSVRVQVGEDEKECFTFQAHKTPVRALTINAQGTLIATASEYGTVIKVFYRSGTNQWSLLHELRRTVTQATVTSLAFREDDRFLAVACSAGAVTIFRIDPEHGAQPDQSQSVDEAPTAPTASVGGTYLGAFSALISTEPRAVALFKIPEEDASIDVRSTTPSILGPQVGFKGKDACLLVLHYNGFLYEVVFDDLNETGKPQICSARAATTWFGVRPGFKVIAPSAKFQTVKADEDDSDEDGFQML